MAALDHYPYPHAEAEFNLYNFHSQEQVDNLADVLSSKDKNYPRVIQLFGERGSGRHYLLRAAAHHVMHRGAPVAVEELSLDGYEPDTPLKALLEHLSRSAKGAASDKLSELCRRVEIKLTSVNLIVASVGVKSDLTVEEILSFFQQTSQTPGPGMSERERLRLFLDRVTQRQRLVLYIRDSRTADIALRLQLTDEADLNPKFFVAFGCLSQDPKTHHLGRAQLRLHVPAWTREEMQRAFSERFQPNDVAADFFDFAWNSGTDTHSRETFARVVLRLVTNNWLFTNRNDSWGSAPDWQRNELLLQEFSRDLFEPVLKIKKRLETSALPKDQIVKLFDFLGSAALCDPTIPVYPLLEMIGVPEGERDYFIEWLDDSFDVENADGILEDLGFQHPGFPPAQLVYRFRNPVLPRAVLKRRSDLCDLAIQVLNFVRGVFRLDTRTIANLYMRVADAGELGNEATQFEKALSYWTSVEETEALERAVTEELKVGAVSPQVVWSIIARSKDSWPPARRLALLKAYGTQSDGIPFGNRFDYFLTVAGILFELGRFAEAINLAEEATVCEWPEPRWQSELVLHNVMGISEMQLGRLDKARNWLESNLRIARANLPAKHLDQAAPLSNFASVLIKQGRYGEARELLQQALAILEEVLSPKHPDLATMLNNLAGVLIELGHYGEARKLFQRALAIEEKAFGPKHPMVATTLNNLAGVLSKEGCYGEARELFQRALAIREQAFGPKHPDVATTLGHLALLHHAEGHHREARELLDRALAIEEEVLGPNHPHVAKTLRNLVVVLNADGHPGDALKLLQRASTIEQDISSLDLSSGS